MVKLQVILVLTLHASICFCLQKPNLESVREWRQLDFHFPSTGVRAHAIHDKQFVPENVFPIDVDVDHAGKVSLPTLFELFCNVVICKVQEFSSQHRGSPKEFQSSSVILSHNRQAY